MGQDVLGPQGHVVSENEFLQDNQSVMKLKQNGRALLCGQKSRHIDIRYFFMKDCIQIEGIDIVYCPTEEMLADFFTKSLQGSLFIRFKKVIMGEEHVSTTLRKPSLAPAKERVGHSDKVEADKELVSGANGQTIDDGGWTVVKKTYSRALMRGAQAPSGGAHAYRKNAATNAAKLTDLSRGKSGRAHSTE
jgi:hypothetical protein